MKLRGAVIVFLCICLTSCLATKDSQVTTAPTASEEKITVLNPMGTPLPIQAKQMTSRMDTLEGKTIYFVNTGYIGTDRLMDVMSDWFKANYPKTNVVIKRSRGEMRQLLRSFIVKKLSPYLQSESYPGAGLVKNPPSRSIP